MHRLRYRQIHLDFHTSEHIPDVGAGFNPDTFADTLAEARVNWVTLFAKCHHGLSYYPTRVGTMHPSLKIASSYKRCFIIALVLQAFFILLGLITFDHGQLSMWVILSLASYWIVALIIVVRRPQSPTLVDLAVIRSGFIVILFLVIAFTSMLWWLSGNS